MLLYASYVKQVFIVVGIYVNDSVYVCRDFSKYGFDTYAQGLGFKLRKIESHP
jgi:hypothetical protein